MRERELLGPPDLVEALLSLSGRGFWLGEQVLTWHAPSLDPPNDAIGGGPQSLASGWRERSAACANGGPCVSSNELRRRRRARLQAALSCL